MNKDSKTLTNQLATESLPEYTEFYVRKKDGSTDTQTWLNRRHSSAVEWWNTFNITEVLAPVPSFEEWQALNEDVDTVTELWKQERSQLNEKIQLIGKLSVQAVDLKEENQQLRELLKRCRDFINYEVPDHCIDDVLIDKIDNVLGEKK